MPPGRFYRADLGRDDVRVGMIRVPRLFGDAVNPHPHLHSLATDGAFAPDGVSHCLLYDTQTDMQTLTELLERRSSTCSSTPPGSALDCAMTCSPGSTPKSRSTPACVCSPEDVLVCPRCSGRMQVIATIMERDVIRAILEACGFPADSPPRAPPELLPDENATYHFVDWVADVVGVADGLGWQRFVLMGHSRGAGVACLVAGTFPERAERLVLLGDTLCMFDRLPSRDRMASNARSL